MSVLFYRKEYPLVNLNNIVHNLKNVYVELLLEGLERPLISDFILDLYKKEYSLANDMIVTKRHLDGRELTETYLAYAKNILENLPNPESLEQDGIREKLKKLDEDHALIDKVNITVRTARKPIPMAGIEKGDVYYSWRHKGLKVSKHNPMVPVIR